MNAFLNVLKNKSATIQASLEVKQPKHIEAIVPISNTAITTHVNIDHALPLIVTVELILNRNRIDVFFNQKPTSVMLASLHAFDFHYRPSDKAWYNKDTVENRKYCEETFGAIFGDIDATQAINSTIDDSITLSTATNEEEKTEDVSKEFLKFRTQTNELIVELKIEPADLMLLAIDALHKQTFSRDS